MNEGVFRDQRKVCGFCQTPIGDECKVISFSGSGRATFHPGCWKPFEKAVRVEVELAVHNRKKEKEMRWNRIVDGFSTSIGWLASAAIVGVAVWIIVSAFSAEDTYVYCQVEGGNDGKFNLEGVREWRPDDTIGSFNSIDDAKEAAEKIGCDLR